MKKTILVYIAVSVASLHSFSQQTEIIAPAPPVENIEAAPAAPPVALAAEIIELPQIPPAPPAPPDIINGNGYEISVRKTKNGDMVIVKKKGFETKILLETWMKNKKAYEKKYGPLPPPPPPFPTEAKEVVII